MKGKAEENKIRGIVLITIGILGICLIVTAIVFHSICEEEKIVKCKEETEGGSGSLGSFFTIDELKIINKMGYSENTFLSEE